MLLPLSSRWMYCISCKSGAERFAVNLTNIHRFTMWPTTTTTQINVNKQINFSTSTKLNTRSELEDYKKINNICDINSNNIDEEYERAIEALNSLQSNAETLRNAINHKIQQSPFQVNLLERSGLSLQEVEQLSFIHVAGSKGKGSTCALTDAILREYGVKTGFFSSPHLVSVQERIRINGEPIEKEKFIKYFWRVFKRLEQTSKQRSDMPAYFKFLTILSWHIYLAEQVDVVIMEVGIGGELDCTNIIRNTGTVGICSLGLEHTQLLGNTLEEIAWQKAGIIKPGSHVFTSVTQAQCLQVIRKRALEKQASLCIVPKFNSYTDMNSKKMDLSTFNNMVQLNGSLAIQLAYDWLRQHRKLQLADTQITSEVFKALNNFMWPGRCQILSFSNFNIYLDGAHTEDSITICSDWFIKETADNENIKVLLFNSTGDRDSKKLLSVLQSKNKFELACFVPNVTSTSDNRKDNQSHINHADQVRRAFMHARCWQDLCSHTESRVFESILDSFQHLRRRYNSNQAVDVLVTGSLHLIGASLLALAELQKDI